MEQDQAKETNKIERQENQSLLPLTPQVINQELQSIPHKIPTKNTRGNLLKQVVDDSEDQNRADIPKILENWPEKL